MRTGRARALRQFTLSTGKSAGRNSSGRITVFHRGGGSKRLLRRIDLKRSTSSMGIVESIEYDPNRSSQIAPVRWIKGGCQKKGDIMDKIMARKGNPISVRLGKNRSSNSSRFSASALFFDFVYFVAPTLRPVLFILHLLDFYCGLGLGLVLGNEMFNFFVGPDGGAPGLDLNEPLQEPPQEQPPLGVNGVAPAALDLNEPLQEPPQEQPPLGVNGVAPAALDLNELPPVHLLYAEVESPQSREAENYEMLAHLRRVQDITQDLETEQNIWRRQALIDILDWEVRSLQRHFRIFRQRNRLRERQRSWLREQMNYYR